MSEQEILSRLEPLFRNVFRDSAIVVTPRTTAADIERWDSLSHVDMIMLVEEEFGIRVPTREVTRMKDVGDLVRVILLHMK